MKKSTMIALTLIIMSIVMIIIGVIIAAIINNQRRLEENMAIIKNTYTAFSVDVVENYQARSDLTQYLDAFSNETYPEEHETYTNIIKLYNDNMVSLNKNLDILEDKCAMKYDDTQTKIFCENYQQLYEGITNVYVKNMTDYNDKITSYNEVIEEDYELASLIVKDYIDFDKDGQYTGKETE